MEINRNNYETFFLLYLDRELNPAGMQEVESFLDENADLQKEFTLLQQAIFVPPPMVFEQKESLYRHEEKRRVIPFYWMRMAAAVAALIIGSWLLIAKSFKTNPGSIEQAQQRSPVNKMPLAEIKKEEKGNHGALSDSAFANNQPELIKNAPVAQLKSETTVRKKNSQQKTSIIPEEQNADQDVIPDEPLLAMKKTTTPELQSAENSGDKNPTQVAAMSGTGATSLVLASAKSSDRVQQEDVVLKENGYATDNAISVVSLNNDKGISGFLKKITRRAPADDQSRKLRLSVFQISY